MSLGRAAGVPLPPAAGGHFCGTKLSAAEFMQ